jgi:hypothetical protein
MATWGSQTWGYENWGTLGDQNVSLTGIAISSNLGSPSIDTEVNVGWGSDTWGFETWGISGQNADVTGISLSANLGTLAITADASTAITGEQLSSNLGTLDAFASFTQELTGLSMTMSVNFDPEIVDLNGISLSANLGTSVLDANTIVELTTEVTPGWGASVGWSEQEWGQASIQMAMSMDEGTVDPSPDATVTGIGFGMAVATGTVVTGEANVTVVGEGFSAALGTGTLDAVTFADATAIAMTANLGSIANVTGNANVTPTGIELTMALNSVNALIWNEVNTGSAPIDPPGWQEVPTRAA